MVEHDEAIADLAAVHPPSPRSNRLLDSLNSIAGAEGARGLLALRPSRLRDDQVTVASATRDCEWTLWKDPEKIDALAAAHARAGNDETAAKQRKVAWATRICSLSDWKDPDTLAALAAADAEAGDFDAAIKWQTLANALYSVDKAKSEGEARLKLYQGRMTFRSTRP